MHGRLAADAFIFTNKQQASAKGLFDKNSGLVAA